MRSVRAAQIIASGTGVAALLCLVTTITYLTVPGEKFLPIALFANGFAVTVAIAAWTGVLFKRKNDEMSARPQSWVDWIGVFFIGSALSSLFLFIDCDWHLPTALGGTTCNGHIGIGLIFTIAAIALSAIALPSALRAWLLQRLMKMSNSSQEASPKSLPE